MRRFAADLAAARASIIRDPVDAVIAAVMEHFGIEEDPTANIGLQDEWYHNGWARDTAERLLLLGLGLTHREATRRMGRVTRLQVRRTYPLESWELDVLDEADALRGRAR